MDRRSRSPARRTMVVLRVDECNPRRAHQHSRYRPESRNAPRLSSPCAGSVGSALPARRIRHERSPIRAGGLPGHRHHTAELPGQGLGHRCLDRDGPIARYRSPDVVVLDDRFKYKVGHTPILRLKKGGKVVASGKTSYSKDGKIRTLTWTEIDDKGKNFENTAIYARQ